MRKSSAFGLRCAAEAACVPVQTDALMTEETDAAALQRYAEIVRPFVGTVEVRGGE